MGSARASNKMNVIGGYNTATNISNPVASNNLVVKIIGFKDSNTKQPLANAVQQ